MSKMPPTTPLERYLDGQLSEADRQRVERALEANPGAQEQVRLQRKIDDALGRLFAKGSEAAIPIPIRRRIPVWPLAAAAAVLIVLAGVWAVFIRTPGGGRAGPSPLAAVYRTQVDGGFVPKEVCTTRDKFADWVQRYYQQPLYPPETHEGVEFVGWSYAKAVSGNSGVLLARVQGKEVIVVIDRTVRDKHPFTSSGDPHLNMFRRQVGTVVLYEVTPLPEASIVPLLSTTK